MEVILNRCVIMDKREDRLRSGSWLLRSLIVWKAERCYLWSIDVGRADPEKPNGKESKGRKGFWNYEKKRFSLLYLDLHFDDNISGSYVEGIQRF